MSGLARAAKKHWKRKLKTFKKYWKVVAIAVVAYFTFGMALGAMAPAAGTVSAGAGAASTGAGVMTATGAAAGSTAAAATGAAAATAGIETVTVTAAASGGFSAGAGAAAAGAAGAAAAGAAGQPTGAPPSSEPVTPAKPATQQPPQAMQSTAKPGIMDKAKAGWKEMSFSDKLLLAKAGVDVATAATGPSPEEEAAAAAKWQGAFYGRDAKEAEQFVNQQTRAAQPPPATAPGSRQQRDLVGSGGVPADPGATPAPPGTPMPPTQRMQFEANAQPTQRTVQTPEQVTNQGGNRDLFAQRAPGVRYLV